jgi:hypothetical protein
MADYQKPATETVPDQPQVKGGPWTVTVRFTDAGRVYFAGSDPGNDDWVKELHKKVMNNHGFIGLTYEFKDSQTGTRPSKWINVLCNC